MSFKPAQSFKRGQIWEAGFDGIYNTENAVDSITGKVGELRSSRPAVESTTQQIARQREREAFDRTVVSRAENFRQAFSKLDLDGDGRLSFDEFSQGLHQLGVILPRNEVEAIWGQEMAGRPWQEHTDNQQTLKANDAFRHPSPAKVERIGTGEIHRARTSISVEPFAHHRNAYDHITAMQSEEVDELQSPLKGNQRSARTGVSLAHKRAAVADRNAKRNVVNEEKKRNSVRRKVVDDIGARGVAFRQAFAAQFAGPDSVTFNEYKINMKKLGVVLSDEDFFHLWDLCAEPQHYVGESESSNFGSGGVNENLKPREPTNRVSVASLAETVGISVADAFIGNKDKEKERKCMKKAAIVGQKLANTLKGRKHHLRQALVISDISQTGMLDFEEFKSCLGSVGIILGDSDCLAVVGASRDDKSGEVDYQLFLQQIELDSHFYRGSQHLFQDKEFSADGAEGKTDSTDIRDVFRHKSRPKVNKRDNHSGLENGRGEQEMVCTRSRSPPWEEHPESLPVNHHDDPRLKREAISQARIGLKVAERLPELQRHLRGSGRVTFDAFSSALQDAGLVLDSSDVHVLFDRARDHASGAFDLTRLARDWQGLVPMRSLRPSGVQGYSSSPECHPSNGGHRAAEEDPKVSIVQSHDSGNMTTNEDAHANRSTGAGGWQGCGEALKEKWAHKIALSKVGNPYQLAHMFRKYDTEQGKHSKTVLLGEFVQVIMDGNLEVPRADVVKLSVALDRGDGNIDYMDFIRSVKAAKDRVSLANTLHQYDLREGADLPSPSPSFEDKQQEFSQHYRRLQTNRYRTDDSESLPHTNSDGMSLPSSQQHTTSTRVQEDTRSVMLENSMGSEFASEAGSGDFSVGTWDIEHRKVSPSTDVSFAVSDFPGSSRDFARTGDNDDTTGKRAPKDASFREDSECGVSVKGVKGKKPDRHRQPSSAAWKMGADRGSWIEQVVNNSMRDVSHRYETQRLRKLSAPAAVKCAPPLVLHVRKPPPVP